MRSFLILIRLAWLLLGVKISPMTLWRLTQRMGEAAAQYSDALSLYHGDSRSSAAPITDAPKSVVLAVDGCCLGMQVRSRRRRRKAGETLPPGDDLSTDNTFNPQSENNARFYKA